MTPEPYPAPKPPATTLPAAPASAQQLTNAVAALTHGREQPIPSNTASWAWHPARHKGFL